jgi:hypothetical protein
MSENTNENPNENPNDPHLYTRLRAEHLQQRYGDDTIWDREFAPVDATDAKARANVVLEVKEDNGVWSCDMPVEVSPKHFEWRRLEADGYDALVGMINTRLRSGPTIRELTPEQELRLARMCVTKNKSALAAC